jgi:hypothetical protein
MSDGSGIALGIVGTAAGIVAVDYLYSEPGESWVAQLFSLFESKADPAPPKQITRAYRESLAPIVRQQRQPLQAPPQQHALESRAEQSSSEQQRSRRRAVVHATDSPAAGHVTDSLFTKEVAVRLNALLHLHLPTDGSGGAQLHQAVRSVQQQLKVSPTGVIDMAFVQLLRQRTPSIPVPQQQAARTAYVAGADAGVNWQAETKSLGSFAQSVITKVLAEGDTKTLKSLGLALAAAGFHVAANAVNVKGGLASAQSFGPGF